MTFDQWARTQGYRLDKRNGYYTSPATLAAQQVWRAAQQAMQSQNTLRVVK